MWGERCSSGGTLRNNGRGLAAGTLPGTGMGMASSGAAGAAHDVQTVWGLLTRIELLCCWELVSSPSCCAY